MCGCTDAQAQTHIVAAGVTVIRDLVKLEWLGAGEELHVLGPETKTRYRFTAAQPMQFIRRRDVPGILEQHVGQIAIIDGDAYAALQRAG